MNPCEHESVTKRAILPNGLWLALAVATLTISACGGGGGSASPPLPLPLPPIVSKQLVCDDSMKENFKADGTTVVLVKAFKAGDSLALASTPATPLPEVSPVDVCLVKLVVGPGNPGPADAPSTSPGIGLEIWLPNPSKWNKIIRAIGNAGWAGGVHADPTRVNGALLAPVGPIIGEGYVVATSDNGHGLPSVTQASFLMNPNGGINTALWSDFSERSLHELAVKTKALVLAYYNEPQKYAYWDGLSTGGRQGMKLAQKYPTDFNGILAGMPAMNWSRFLTADLYPQIAMQRELGANIPTAKLNFVSGAAVKSCDTLGLGFLVDPLQCRYDPTKDAQVLCSGEAGNGVTGASANAACISNKEARVFNQIWYGQTLTGTFPDPASDNGNSPSLGSPDHLWFAPPRGADLTTLAGPEGFAISQDLMALHLQDPSYGATWFTNATGNGTAKWKTLDYVGLANVYTQGVALQPFFGNINTDNPDLSGLRDAGTKLLTYHGLADGQIPSQGSINYFTRMAAQMGGNVASQAYARLFLIPGYGHYAIESIDPATLQRISGTKLPLPRLFHQGGDDLFLALRNWVENGNAPSRIDLQSTDNSVSMPICVFPQKATYAGAGPVTAAASYSCK
ncbi:feruloyl esterase [Variovorax boronicumulans]|uniref:tannase/feruloyl esterase family alpha/beta hydrolase n=1 Tax=Variovorax boronicumulans TaxID=436515 RepID=UPI00277DB42B|nr:tannase/feruloyl esterase family alpha/beta hydrolase [Variovorax boronicumulans]MDQ0038459.1 feruloyl esterase [Variovorax boronicumulans]